MDVSIKANGLTKHYADFSLENIDLQVESGTVVGLVGSNGAGKTTTLKILLGIMQPDEGSAEVLGSPIESKVVLNGKIKQHIGVVLDTCPFYETAKVSDIATLGRFVYSNWNAQKFASLCRKFNLAPKKTIKELSRGMGMKLMLAFALSHEPDVLILDEATAGLDPIARDEVLSLLRNFMEDEGHAILLSTHITSDLEKIADEIVCIDEGQLIFDLPKDEICDRAGIAHCRERDLEMLREAEWENDKALRMLKNGMTYDVLIPDRFTCSRRFPTIAVDRASIDDYMTLTLKGEAL